MSIDWATHSHYSQLTLVVIVESLSEFFPIGFDQGHDSFGKLTEHLQNLQKQVF